ncbi:hypothetical protein [Catellatospora sp. NPDC049133]|uniref:hypothetical protein n=1 Tax=Catellatospora sp. NPDC049133 TaxID=3155499 RepID=UPI0033CB2A26
MASRSSGQVVLRALPLWFWWVSVAVFALAPVMLLLTSGHRSAAFLTLVSLGYAVGLGRKLQHRSAEREQAAHVAQGTVPSWSLLKVEVVELVEDDWPGLVRVRLVDADGRAATFVDKIPIFFEEFTSATALPAPGHVRCWVVDSTRDGTGRRLVVSTVMDGVTSEDGRDEFHVRPDQVEAPHGGPAPERVRPTAPPVRSPRSSATAAHDRGLSDQQLASMLLRADFSALSTVRL